MNVSAQVTDVNCIVSGRDCDILTLVNCIVSGRDCDMLSLVIAQLLTSWPVGDLSQCFNVERLLNQSPNMAITPIVPAAADILWLGASNTEPGQGAGQNSTDSVGYSGGWFVPKGIE